MYSIIMGEDFSSFASKMISPEAELLIKYATENIFKKSTIGRNIDNSFKTIKEGLSPYKYLSRDDINMIAGFLKEKGYKIEYVYDKKGKPTEFVDANKTVFNALHSFSLEELRKILSTFKADSNLLNNLNIKKGHNFSEDDFDDSYIDVEEQSKGPSYKNTLLKLSRYATDVMELRKDSGFKYVINKDDSISVDSSDSKLNIGLLAELEDVSIRSKSLRILGQMLGINQSIKADPESLNKYFENLEVYYNQIISQNGLTSVSNVSFDERIANEILKRGFDARKFGIDEEYRNVAIDLFDVLKYDINIFDVIANSLHFFEMYKAAIYAEAAINNASKRLRITNKLIDKLRNDGFIQKLKVDGDETPFKGSLPKKVYTKLSNIASDIINIRFFDEKDIKVKLRNSDYVFDKNMIRSKIESDTMNVPLNSYAGRRSFVEWFENRVIPDLKNGVTKNTEGIYNEQPSESLLSNEFVRSLKLVIDEDRNTGVRFVKYTLPIKMTSSKTLDEKIMFDTFAEHFRNLGETTYDGQSITDLFYLYNLIVNGNNVNNDSLTRIFESNFNYVLDSSKIKSHLRFIGDLDYNENNDNYKYLDYVNDNVLVAAGVYSPITENELSNGVAKQTPLVKKMSRNYDGILVPSYYKLEVVDNKKVYTLANVDLSLTSKYINTIDVNNGLKSYIGFSSNPEVKQKITSNLISYKIKCE